MSLFTVSGELLMTTASDTPASGAVLDRLTRSLRDEGARCVERKRDAIVFHGTFISFAYKGGLLNSVTTGRVSVEEKDGKVVIAYRLAFGLYIILTTCFFGLLALGLLCGSSTLDGGTPGSIFLKAGLALPVMWLAFVPGAVVLSILRFRRFLRKCLLPFELIT